jgi:hypothetical protein
MATKLNPKAAEFVPGSYKSTDSNWGPLMEAEELGEVRTQTRHSQQLLGPYRAL